MNSCLAQGPRAEFPDWTGSFWERVPSISSAMAYLLAGLVGLTGFSGSSTGAT